MLALVGSGEYLPAIEPLDRDLISRLQRPPRVVCLPTAAGREGPARISYWSRLGVEHFARLGAEVEAIPVIDRASANDATLATAISGASFVYLSGGKPDYLYATLDGSLAWEAIVSVLAGGGLLAGCSAGAMVMGEVFYGFPGWRPGFSLLPGVTVMPHYDEIPVNMVRLVRSLTRKGLALVGIERNTALVETGRQYEVLGSGGVTVWKGRDRTRYTCGPLPGGVLAQ